MKRNVTLYTLCKLDLNRLFEEYLIQDTFTLEKPTTVSWRDNFQLMSIIAASYQLPSMRYIQFVFMVTDYAVYISHFVRHFFKERQKKSVHIFIKKLTQTGDVKFCTLKYSKIPLCTLYTQKVISDEVIVFWRAFARLTDKKNNHKHKTYIEHV